MRSIHDVPIIALDGLGRERALELAMLLGRHSFALKAHDLIDAEGGEIITDLKKAGAHKVMDDAKLHDVPRTVAKRAAERAKHGGDILTVHAAGGKKMMQAAVEAYRPGEVYAISVLTSLSPEEVEFIFGRSVEDQVKRLGTLAAEAGVAGLVCSPLEVGTLSNWEPTKHLKYIVPATRLPGAGTQDQARVATPLAAITDGASHLVWGTEVVTAADPVAAFQAHLDNIRPAFAAAVV